MTHKPHMTLESGEKLYEGEYGITRNGDRVGPVRADGYGLYPWSASGEEYTDKGEYYFGGTNGEDIIARAALAALGKEPTTWPPMTDYNDGKWHGWNGGECPLHPETEGEFVFADGCICSRKPAGEWQWDDKELPLIAFRVTKEHKEPVKPREWFVLVDKYGEIVEVGQYVDELDQSYKDLKCIVVREVLE